MGAVTFISAGECCDRVCVCVRARRGTIDPAKPITSTVSIVARLSTTETVCDRTCDFSLLSSARAWIPLSILCIRDHSRATSPSVIAAPPSLFPSSSLGIAHARVGEVPATRC